MGGISRILVFCLLATSAVLRAEGFWGRQVSRGALQGNQFGNNGFGNNAMNGYGNQFGGGMQSPFGGGFSQSAAEYKSRRQEITQQFDQEGSRIRDAAKAEHQKLLEGTQEIVTNDVKNLASAAKTAQEEATKTTAEFLKTLTSTISSGHQKLSSTGSADAYAKNMAEMIAASAKNQVVSMQLMTQLLSSALTPAATPAAPPPPQQESQFVSAIRAAGSPGGLTVNEFANPFQAAMQIRLQQDAAAVQAGKQPGGFLPGALQTQDGTGRAPGDPHFGHSHGGGSHAHHH